MARISYFYLVAPAAIVVATAVLLTIPYLALIVLLAVVVGAFAGLIWGLVRASRVLVDAVSRLWSRRVGTTPEPEPEPVPVVLTSATRQSRSLGQKRLF